MNRCFKETDLPEWMTKKKKDHVNPKRKYKGTAHNNNRPITYLPMM